MERVLDDVKCVSEVNVLLASFSIINDIKVFRVENYDEPYYISLLICIKIIKLI